MNFGTPKPFRRAIATILGILLLGGSGAPSAAMTTGTLLLSLRDSRTGRAVVPQRLQIDGTASPAEVDAAGLLAVELGGGNHQIAVEAEGYSRFEATVTVDGDQTPVTTFELDRLTSGLAEETVPLPSDQAGLDGYVVDASYGSPVSSASVEVSGRKMLALTDAEGHFTLTVPVLSGTADGPQVAERVTLHVSREGYVAEERRNVELISGTTMTTTVQLDRITSESEQEVRVVDEGLKHAPRLSSWRFDVTLD